MFRNLTSEKVYITEDVDDDPRALARAERMCTAVPGATPERVSYAELNEIALQRWANGSRWGANPDPRDPDLVLTMGKFWTEAREQAFREQYPNLGRADLYGFRTHVWRADGELGWRQGRRGCICQSARQLHTIMGCPFRCAYCGCGGVNRVLVNIEEYVEHLDDICAMEPAQRLYKWDNVTDVTAFEPEYDASRPLIEYFARKPGKYLEIYVGKSDNVDNLLDLDHRGKTILQWSISAKTQSTVIEPETATWEERVEAARKCQEAGYIVRYRFSPIVPVRNWEAENAELIERIFTRTNPDVISLCPFGWMSVEDTRECMDFSLWDPRYVAAMEASAPFLEARGFTGGGGRPIPHDARAHLLKTLIDQIRSHNRTIPIALCLETVEMWALFQRELGTPINPEKGVNYYCNCGPMCTPEHPLSKGVPPGKSWFDPE